MITLEKILNAIPLSGSITIAQLHERLGVSKSAITKHLTRLIRHGVVTKERGYGKTYHYRRVKNGINT